MCVEEQDMLGTEDNITKFLGIIADDEMKLEVRNILNKHLTSGKKWEAFVNFFKDQIHLVCMILILLEFII
jgi:hypothetical protein